ncbi:MAG: hypothetical protein H0V76_01125 [Blastocatellia bacterium]|nr:hypothetical protein [Blastocatellia bacterium]
MNKFFRFAGHGFALAAVLAVGSTVGYAQDPCEDFDGQAAVYEKFTANMAGDLAKRKVAVTAGKEYLEKYGACEGSKDIAAYLKTNLPPMEEAIKKQEAAETTAKLFERYDAGVQKRNYDEAYAAGRTILAQYPDNLNVMLPLSLIGLYESYDKNFKYNEDTLKYARQALQMLKSGKEATKKNKEGVPVYGVFQFERNKEDAISELNYTIAYILYHVKNDKKGALPYYYDVAQNPGALREEPRVYQTVGAYYLENAGKIGEEIAKMIEELKTITDEDARVAKDAEIKKRIALFNGYTERALDAYSRAHKVTKDDAANKEYKAGLYKTIQTLYERRFDKKDGIDAYIASTVAKPMPNPTTEVSPVAESEPATNTTGRN